MSIEPGSRIGPYAITSSLGEGGMGVVYRAQDTRLQRDVALKLLPEHFAKDPDRLSRFQREAQVLASLNHPNIAQIYGFEEMDGSGCIVMELVEGETLAERLKNGPLPIDEAVRIAKQLADALAAAHERGIVHRDLKPANIKETPTGTVKVLDFGLAKALSVKAQDSSLTAMPTKLSGSVAGTVVGTAAYMSPEQARGREVDARTDIWAFGCVLYEMLTGRLAFEGETATDIMAKIVTGQPDLNLLPPATPSSIRALLAATLNKNVQQRLQHIGDMRLFLDETLFPSVENTAQGKKPWALVAALAVALVIALIPAVLYFRPAPTDTTAMRFEISIPGLVNNAVAISPDGQRIASIVQSDDGQRSLWVRPIDSEESQQVSGTENLSAFRWSPDSRYLAFLVAGTLKKIDPSGGSAQVICDTAGVRFYTWNRTGTILFARSSDNVIVSVADTGGDVKPVTTLDASRKEVLHTLPVFLPDGNRFLYGAVGAVPDTSAIYVASLDSKTAPTRVVPLNLMRFNGMAYAPPGYLVYALDGKLIAHRFDPGTAKVAGDPMTLSDDIDGGFAVTDTGLLTFRKNAPLSASNKQLTWFDREGRHVEQIGAMANYGGIELSPTGDRLAVDIVTDNNRDIWVIDLARNVPSRITFDPATESTASWSPDGSRLAFASAGRGNEPQQIYQKSSSGVGVDELVATDGGPSSPMQWSPDNKFIVFSRAKGGGSGGNDMWLLPLTGDRKPKAFLQTPFEKIHARISPDARWIAYATNESGSFQVVVQSFPDPNGGKWQISADGGVEPKWRHDGKELYYLALDGKLMSVPVKADRTFEAGRPVPLFQTVLTVNRTRPDRDRRYEVNQAGQRFLIVTPGNRSGVVPVTVMVNWPSAFK